MYIVINLIIPYDIFTFMVNPYWFRGDNVDSTTRKRKRMHIIYEIEHFRFETSIYYSDPGTASFSTTSPG